MSLNLKVLSERLLRAREVLGYSTDEVSEKIGISQARILAIESAMQKPSGDEVLILASFYDCDFRGFLDDELPSPVEQSDILFRRFGGEFSSNDRRAIQQFLYLCSMKKMGTDLFVRVEPANGVSIEIGFCFLLPVLDIYFGGYSR